MRSLWHPLSSDYRAQYTIPTIHTNIITRSISQSVFSINQAKPDITAQNIIVIIVAVNNFIQSITICRLRNKLYHLYYHKTLAQVSFIDFLTHYIFYFFQNFCFHLSRFVIVKACPHIIYK